MNEFYGVYFFCVQAIEERTVEMTIELPRYWKVEIRRLTGLNFCDSSCDCGENNQLWWFTVYGRSVPSWLPEWMNGGDTYEIWRWLVENGRVK